MANGSHRFKYVSRVTKSLILEELTTRVASSEEEARVVAQSFGIEWNLLIELLHSTDVRIRQSTWKILENLIPVYDYSCRSDLCGHILSLLRSHPEVQQYAVYTLLKIPSYFFDVARIRTAMEQVLVEEVPRLLSSSGSETRRWTCEMLGNLPFHRYIIPKNIYAQIVTPLSDEDSDVRYGAILAVSKISQWYDGAHGIDAFKIWERDFKLLDLLLDFDNTRLLTYETLSNLAFHKALPGLGAELLMRIELLLSDGDPNLCTKRESDIPAKSVQAGEPGGPTQMDPTSRSADTDANSHRIFAWDPGWCMICKASFSHGPETLQHEPPSRQCSGSAASTSRYRASRATTALVGAAYRLPRRGPIIPILNGALPSLCSLRATVLRYDSGNLTSLSSQQFPLGSQRCTSHTDTAGHAMNTWLPRSPLGGGAPQSCNAFQLCAATRRRIIGGTQTPGRCFGAGHATRTDCGS
ncbi:hypothetical protein B0H19DRAFT_1245488 [Mycena capillaripes]|nr:hypothetical protein B0H19DRAFT_1245488 [Mycena capillaripes]